MYPTYVGRFVLVGLCLQRSNYTGFGQLGREERLCLMYTRKNSPKVEL